MAALEAGMITPDFRVSCPGIFTLGDHDYHCWKTVAATARSTCMAG